MTLTQLLAMLATQPAPQDLLAVAVALLAQVERQSHLPVSTEAVGTPSPPQGCPQAGGHLAEMANLCDQLRRIHADALETEERLSQLLERSRDRPATITPPAVTTTCHDSAAAAEETPAVLHSIEMLDVRIRQTTLDLVYLGIQLNGAMFDSNHENHPPQLRAQAQRTAFVARHRMEHLEALLHELDQQRRNLLDCCGLPNFYTTQQNEN